MSGSLCSEARYEEIDRQWNGHLRDDETRNKAEAPEQSHAESEAEIPDPDELVMLRDKLAKLERLPENEAIQFQLESEIYQLEREMDQDKWQDIIGGTRVS